MDPRDLILSPQLDEARVAEVLSAYGFSDPNGADQCLQRIVALTGRPRLLAELTARLLESLARSGDPDDGLRGLESLVERVASPVALLSHLDASPSALDVVCAVLGNSPFLGRILIRNPEYLYWLTEGERLSRVDPASYFGVEAALAVRPAAGDPEAALDGLRRLKRRETLRIGAQDLLDTVPFEELVGQVSDLASTILEQALETIRLDVAPDCPAPVILALGKLGGRELNFSSDIDLIYVHPDDADEPTVRRVLRRLTRGVSESSSQGRLYRVDLRLRPMGSSGEISYSATAMHTYYETWAETPDRLALLKCRPVAGPPELGESLIESLREFVYRRYLDKAAIEEIRWIKHRTDRQQRRRAPQRNVKLGAGGIREVEFFVQALQLLYGGQQPRLQTPNTLQALDRLEAATLISADDAALLREAYVFLRRLEHRLQLVADRQTHHLPAEPARRRQLARRMGFAGKAPEEALQRRLDNYRSKVHELFRSLFPALSGRSTLQRLVLGQAVAEDAVAAELSAAGVGEPAELLAGFRGLATASAFPHSPGRVRNLLANLAPGLLEQAVRSDDPARLLKRLDSFAGALGARGDLYLSLVDNDELAARLFRVLALSDFLASRLIRHPELLDGLAFPGLRFDPGSALDGVDPSADSLADRLRAVKARDEFKVGASVLLDGAFDDAPAALTRIAERCLRLAWRRAIANCPGAGDEPLAVVALGKLAGRELSLDSDLDIVIVHDDARSPTEPARLLPLVDSLRHTLHSYTRHGRAYAVDLRLRPEGRKGIEVTPLSLLRTYFDERADAWEKLAWRKRRIVASNAWKIEAGQLFELQPFSSDERAALAHIRTRKETELALEDRRHSNLKTGRGGLLDVHFCAGLLGARSGVEHPSTAAVLDALPDRRIARPLAEGFCFLSHLEIALELLDEHAGDRIPRDPEANRVLADVMRLESGEELVERYDAVTASNRSLYEEVMAGC